MEYRVLLRHRVKVYGTTFQVELREFRSDYFQLVDVFDRCEHDRGIPYHTIEDAIRGFEAACGVTVSEEMKSYLENR